MHRSPLLMISIACLGAAALAQESIRSRLAPITSPIRHAGVYHVSTGRWTRNASLANAIGPSTIYNNTCAYVYFTGILSTELYQHRGRIPSTTGPTTDSIFYGTSDPNHRYDERPGNCDAYTMNGFEVGYCSSHIGTLDWQYSFANSYTACGASDILPQYTISVTGLPAGSSTGTQNCWIVDVDLSGESGGGIVLLADGDGRYDGPSTADQFGFAFRVTPATYADFTGPMITGDFTWTGGGALGVHTPCTGTDGTSWDSTIDPNELGTGMASSDFFRCTGCQAGPSGSGCYYFGGNPHADFYLKLFASRGCPPGEPALVKFCAPGVGGIISCPCGNPQVPPGSTRGCNNFLHGGTGGAVLEGFGVASVHDDTLSFQVSNGILSTSTALTVLFQGTTGTADVRSGAGVRCVGGMLRRLYKGNQSTTGWILFPNNGVSVHDASAAKGFPIVPPVTLDYYAVYRNSAANGQVGCPGLSFGFNTTNAGSVAWRP